MAEHEIQLTAQFVVDAETPEEAEKTAKELLEKQFGGPGGWFKYAEVVEMETVDAYRNDEGDA